MPVHGQVCRDTPSDSIKCNVNDKVLDGERVRFVLLRKWRFRGGLVSIENRQSIVVQGSRNGPVQNGRRVLRSGTMVVIQIPLGSFDFYSTALSLLREKGSLFPR